MFIKVDALWRSEDTDNLFMKVCKEGYVMLALPSLKPMPRGDLPRPVVFHDERFVQKPSPTLALLTVLWIPIGLVLVFLRNAAGALLPMNMVYHAFHALSVRVTIRGNSPPPPSRPAVRRARPACTAPSVAKLERGQGGCNVAL
jgi:hypothetical protein